MATEMEQKVHYTKTGDFYVSSELFIDLIFNDKCNCRCPFCIAETKQFAEENFEKWKRSLVETFELFDIRNIVILGGEATIDPRFFEKLAFLKQVIASKNVDNVILTTNGIMLKNDAFLKKVIDSCITTINLSYMNANKEKNDFLMQGKTLTKEQLKHIYEQIKRNNMSMRLNVNVYQGNCDTIEELENYVETLKGCADVIKFSPLMVTDMFDTKEEITSYTNLVGLTNTEIKVLYDHFASRHTIIKENKGVFGLIPYKELEVYHQRVILKYQQVEDTYDLDSVIPTLKLYYNGNLANEWDFRKNLLDYFKGKKDRKEEVVAGKRK